MNLPMKKSKQLKPSAHNSDSFTDKQSMDIADLIKSCIVFQAPYIVKRCLKLETKIVEL